MVGAILLGVSLLVLAWGRPSADIVTEKVTKWNSLSQSIKEVAKDSAGAKEQLKSLTDQRTKLESEIAPNGLKPWIVKLSPWQDSPTEAFTSKKGTIYLGLLVTMIVLSVVFAAAVSTIGQNPIRFALAFMVIFLLAVIAFLVGGHKLMDKYNLEYALWALFVGLFISNTIGTPKFLQPALRTELYIKTGLVLLGAEVLLNRLLALGLPGVFCSWLVTPIVLIVTYAFGQKFLKMESKSLNIVISADMSVCGVSAAIATAAASRAKKEELSLAIGLSMGFTILMIVVMPGFIKATGMNQVVAGAWIGGTVDSTGAVAAAGTAVSPLAAEVAATVKMIQNILIGFVALGVAMYWSAFVEPTESSGSDLASRSSGIGGLRIIWDRFPKFVLGFVAASALFSWLQSQGLEYQLLSSGAVDGVTKTIRTWLFCLGFVCIGLESNLRDFMKLMTGGKPLLLYIFGQSLNLALSFLMCYLMFEVFFTEVTRSLSE